ncbi:DUF551 domain-containing protein [Enterobacter kobei]|nr:DUF551 domain-containing protein [Enterobacter kobei]
MSTLTKEWLLKTIAELEEERDATLGAVNEDAANALAAMKLALASLEAEPVAEVCDGFTLRYVGYGPAPKSGVRVGDRLYTAPPAPVSVPEWTNEQCLEFLSIAFRHAEIKGDLEFDDIRLGVKMVDGSRAAMLQGADTELQRKAAIHDTLCEKYNVESLTDFVDWQRNHIAELEAASPAPVGEGETAVMPDYPGYTMTQRECFQAGKKAGLAEAGNSPVIPDGWVACSERMPEDGEKVLTSFRGGMRTAACKVIDVLGHKIFVDELTLFNGVPADHWQPLPAAPRQEVK